MLYSEHLSIADNILENQFFYWNLPLYSGHLLIANIFFENKWCPLWRGSTVAVLEKSLKKQYFLHLIPYNSRLELIQNLIKPLERSLTDGVSYRLTDKPLHIRPPPRWSNKNII